MRSTADSTAVAVDKRPNLISNLFPSVVSGIILGVIGAVIAGVLVNKITDWIKPSWFLTTMESLRPSSLAG